MKNFLLLPLFISLYSLTNAQPSPSSEDWKLKKNENGIMIYSRHEEGVPIDEIKVVSVLHASLSSVVAMLMDVDHYSEWIFRCTESKLLQQVSEKEQYQYQKNDAPYPVSDRDIVVHFTIWQDPKTKIVYTRSVGTPDYVPAKSGIVRIPMFDAGYILMPLPNGDVQVVYTLMLDPGGSLPNWVVNWSIITGPYETTIKMPAQVLKADYQSKKFTFIVDQ